MMRIRETLATGLVALGLAGAAVFAQQAAQPSEEKEQAATVGEPAPDFTLTSIDGEKVTLSELTKEGKIVVLEWFNPDCPWVQLHHQKNKTMQETAMKYADKGVVWVAINSGHEGHPTTGVERNRRAAEEFGISYPILLDLTGKVGKAYGAKTTPHMFVIDRSGILAYAGAIDDHRETSEVAEPNHVAGALDQILAGESVVVKETRPYGCSVKYPRG